MGGEFQPFASQFFAEYPANDGAEETRSNQRLEGERAFKWQIATWARQHQSAGKGTVWLYRLSHTTGIGPFRSLGPGHGAELGHVFDFPRRGLRWGTHGPWNASEDILIDTFHGYLVNFARTGYPNGAGLPEWPMFSLAGRAIELGNPVRAIDWPDATEHRLWDRYMDALRNNSDYERSCNELCFAKGASNPQVIRPVGNAPSMPLYNVRPTVPNSSCWQRASIDGGGRLPGRLHIVSMNADSDEHLAIDAKISTHEQRREFGSYVREARAIQHATTVAISAIARSRVHEFIPEENTRQFMHGTGWSSPASPESVPEEMIRIEDVFTVEWANVADHDLSIVSASIKAIANSMADKQIKNMFQSVSKACDRSGNVVDAVQRSIPDAFMEMLEKIEFGVGADGDVSMPSIYVGPDMADRILNELQSQPPEYQARAEALIEKKKAAALAGEKARLNRFRAARE